MEWWQTTLTVFAGIITCLTMWDKIESRVKAEKQPNKDLESRVEVLERRDLEYKSILAGYEEKLQRDYDSINALKKTMNLMLEAQWVLVDHAKNGNNTKELNDVSEKLKEFVFDK
jgi:DNA repair ATPase RecN